MALRVWCGSRSRRAIIRYVVAVANATDACPDGNERWLLGSPAAAVPPAVYSTGRLRRTITFTQSVAANVQASELANTATCPRRCAGVAPWNDAIPANPITPASNALLAVPADPEKVCRATRSKPGSDAGSHGAVDPQEGGAFGSLVASGMRAATPAATTDTASPQLTLYGACARADAPETARSTRAAAKRRIRAPIRVAGGALHTRCPPSAPVGGISPGPAGFVPVPFAWGWIFSIPHPGGRGNPEPPEQRPVL